MALLQTAVAQIEETSEASVVKLRIRANSSATNFYLKYSHAVSFFP